MSTRIRKQKKIKRICPECHKETDVIDEDDGLFKIQCPNCGAKSVIKLMSRRHKQIDVYT